MNIIGEVDGKNILLVDDLIDTAGTITNASVALKERGAKKNHGGQHTLHTVRPGIPANRRFSDRQVSGYGHRSIEATIRQNSCIECCRTFCRIDQANLHRRFDKYLV